MPTPETTGATDVKGGAAAILSLMGNAATEGEDVPPDEETGADDPTPETEEAAPETETADEPEADGEAEEVPEDTTLTVKVDGKTEKVSLKELKSGYSRQADYTKKTQELAANRKAADAEIAQTQAERSQLQAALTQVKTSLDANAPQRPDPALYDTNPSEFNYQSEMYRRHQEQTQQVQEAQRELTARQTADQQKVMHQHLVEGQKILREKIPSWSDPKVMAKEQASLAEFAKSDLGYTDEELAQVTDPRAVLALHKAWRGHLLATAKPVTPVPLKAVTPTVKPGAQPEGRSATSRKAIEKAAKTGHFKDAAAALVGLI